MFKRLCFILTAFNILNDNSIIYKEKINFKFAEKL